MSKMAPRRGSYGGADYQADDDRPEMLSDFENGCTAGSIAIAVIFGFMFAVGAFLGWPL